MMRFLRRYMTPSVPYSPFHIYGRGAITWYHVTMTVGSLFAVNWSDPKPLSTLPFVAGISTIGSVIGMQLFYVIPTIHLLYITYTFGFRKTWYVTGLELMYGSLDMYGKGANEIKPMFMDEESQEKEDWDQFASKEANDIRKMRTDFWDKVYDKRQEENRKLKARES